MKSPSGTEKPLTCPLLFFLLLRILFYYRNISITVKAHIELRAVLIHFINNALLLIATQDRRLIIVIRSGRNGTWNDMKLVISF